MTPDEWLRLKRWLTRYESVLIWAACWLVAGALVAAVAADLTGTCRGPHRPSGCFGGDGFSMPLFWKLLGASAALALAPAAACLLSSAVLGFRALAGLTPESRRRREEGRADALRAAEDEERRRRAELKRMEEELL